MITNVLPPFLWFTVYSGCRPLTVFRFEASIITISSLIQIRNVVVIIWSSALSLSSPCWVYWLWHTFNERLAVIVGCCYRYAGYITPYQKVYSLAGIYYLRCNQHYNNIAQCSLAYYTYDSCRSYTVTRVSCNTSMRQVILLHLSLIHIWRCRRIERCRSRWSPYH